MSPMYEMFVVWDFLTGLPIQRTSELGGSATRRTLLYATQFQIAGP